jgi:hypothetical protein
MHMPGSARITLPPGPHCRPMERLYLWSAEAIVWALERGLVGERPDLLLLYYPSRLPFAWLLTRWHALLAPLQELGPAAAGGGSGPCQQREATRPLGAAAGAGSGPARLVLARLPDGREAALPAALFEVRAALGRALRSNITDALLAAASSFPGQGTSGRGLPRSLLQRPGAAGQLPHQPQQQGAQECYWQEWLGAADVDLLGRQRPSPQDRTFSSALAVNALLDIWAVEQPSGSGSSAAPQAGGAGQPLPARGPQQQPRASAALASDVPGLMPQPRAVQLRWQPGTPDAVVRAALGGYRHLLHSATHDPSSNAFFSLSVKSQGDLPAFYPSNFLCGLRNHSSCIACDAPASELRRVGFGDVVAGVRGLMPQAEFEAKLRGRCFGRGVPRQDAGRNCRGCFFPHWTSEPLTWSLRALALLRAQLLQPGGVGVGVGGLQ